MRRRASRVLERIVLGEMKADRAIAEAAVGLGLTDRRLLFELGLGSLRWKRRLDFVLEAAARRKMKAIQRSIRWPLRVAAYQLLFLDRIPSYAAVDEAVAEVRQRSSGRATGFANAVLRRIAERRALEDWPVEVDSETRRLALELSYPDFLVERWLSRFGQEAARGMLVAGNTQKPMHLLCFGDRDRLAADLAHMGVETSKKVMSPVGLEVTSGDPLGTEMFRDGRFYIQDDASQAAALVPIPEPRESILDLAAAPGGKTLALLAAEATVRPIAADISLRRTLTLVANCKRVQLDLPAIVADGLRPAVSAGFGRVVVDLPCSGTGTIARHPEIKWRLTAERIDRLAETSSLLLSSAASLLARGGLLCAISCSVEAEENEAVMRRFLASHSDFELYPISGRVARSLERGVVGEGMWRVEPAERHDGFTVHVARRRPRV